MTNPHYYHNPRRRPTADAPHSAAALAARGSLTCLQYSLNTPFLGDKRQRNLRHWHWAVAAQYLCGMDYFRCQHT